MNIYERFNRFCIGGGASKDCEPLWNELVKLYSGRAYHNLDHIEYCLEELDTVAERLDQPTAVEAAIFFHDSMFDESHSALLAIDLLAKYGFDFTGRIDVPYLVCCTDHFRKYPVWTEDGKFIADIDLSILGQSRDRFREYDAKVREEYKYVPEDKFLFSRKNILRKFLKPYRDNIYQTTFFRNKYEQQASLNLSETIMSYSYRLDELGVTFG